MGRVCSVCTCPNRKEIDKALVAGAFAKRTLAHKYGLTSWSLLRHEARHLSPALVAAHEKAVEKECMTARDNIVEAVTDLKRKLKDYDGVRDDQWLEFMDRFVRANEQFARINKELGSDQVNALFIALGVRNEEEVKQRLEMTRIGDPGPQDMIDEGCALIEMALARDSTLWHKVHARLGNMSHAEEVNGNGTNGEIHAALNR